jgi:hypothetical protein
MLATSLLGFGSLTAAAHAQSAARLQPAQFRYYDDDRHESREFHDGYRDGSNAGKKDARHRRGFRLEGNNRYRGHSDHEYREGFERGYRESYRANGGDWDHDVDRH